MQYRLVAVDALDVGAHDVDGIELARSHAGGDLGGRQARGPGVIRNMRGIRRSGSAGHPCGVTIGLGCHRREPRPGRRRPQ